MNNSELPRVYIVILNWNQYQLTHDCLDSLSEMDYPAYTVVLVDNGSTDDSPQRIREDFPQVFLIEIPGNIGYSAGNNLGISYAMGRGADYIMLLNNDTIVAPNALTLLIAAAEANPMVGIVGPTMFYFEPSDLLWGGKNIVDWHRGSFRREGLGERTSSGLELRPAVECDYIDSCAILIKREVIDAIGTLDERFFINFDDVDLNTRARTAGFKVIYVPPARIWHKVSAAMGQASPATSYYMTRNSLLFFWVHGTGLFRIWAVALNLARAFRTIAAWSIRPRYRSFRGARDANIQAITDFLKGRFGKSSTDFARLARTD